MYSVAELFLKMKKATSFFDKNQTSKEKFKQETVFLIKNN